MGLFGQKKISYIGADIGAGGIKLVELKNEKGRARLVTYSFTERMPGAQPANLIDTPQETAQLLKRMVEKAKTTTPKAVAGLPIASVFSSVITIPKGTEQEEKEAIEWQAKKLIPVPLEEMVLDYKRVSMAPEQEEKKAAKGKDKKDKKDDKAEEGKEGEEKKKEEKKPESKNQQVLITGASKAMVQKYVAVFKIAGLELVSLETEAFALIRALVGKDRATTMIVDMGALRTNIIIVENGVPFVTRSLDLGGASFTRAMGKALALDVREAEQMKVDIKSVSSLYPDDGLPKIFENTVAPMITELQYSMNMYKDEEGNPKPVEKIILTGGGAGLPSLATYISGKLNTRTYVGDPWARVVYPDELRPVLDEIGPRYAVGIGLGMRDIE